MFVEISPKCFRDQKLVTELYCQFYRLKWEVSASFTRTSTSVNPRNMGFDFSTHLLAIARPKNAPIEFAVAKQPGFAIRLLLWIFDLFHLQEAINKNHSIHFLKSVAKDQMMTVSELNRFFSKKVISFSMRQSKKNALQFLQFATWSVKNQFRIPNQILDELPRTCFLSFSDYLLCTVNQLASRMMKTITEAIRLPVYPLHRMMAV